MQGRIPSPDPTASRGWEGLSFPWLPSLIFSVPFPALTGYGIFIMDAAMMSFLFTSHFYFILFFPLPD